MHHGVFIFPTDYSIRIDELARAVEERGFESLFVTEHTHIPTSRRSPFAGGGPLPKENPEARDRDLSRHRARSDHPGEDDREPRSALQRTLLVRHRGWVER